MLYAPPANLHMMLATFMIQAVYNGRNNNIGYWCLFKNGQKGRNWK